MGLNEPPKFPKIMSKIQGLGSNRGFLNRLVGCIADIMIAMDSITAEIGLGWP